MIVQSHCKLQKPLVFNATRLLVTYDDGTPMALIVSYGPRHVRVVRADDKDFNEQLRVHGIKQTVIVNPMDFGVGSPNIFRG